MSETKGINKMSEIICFIITIAFMFGFKYIPAPDPLTPYGMQVLGVFIGLIIGWCTLSDTLPTSLLGIVAYGLTLPAGVFGSMQTLIGSYIAIMMIVGFFSIGALMGSGVSEWLVYKVCSAKFAKGKPWVLMAVIYFGTWIIGSVTNITLVVLFMYSILSTLFEQAGFKPGDKTPVMIVLTLSCCYLTAMIIMPWMAPQLLIIQWLAGIGFELSFAKYVLIICCVAAVTILCSLALLKITGCEVNKFTEIDFTFLEEKYAGGLGNHQKGVLLCVLLLAIGSFVIAFIPQTSSIYGFLYGIFGILGWMLLINAVMLFVKIDGKRLLSPGDMSHYFKWDIIFIVSLGITVGTALTSDATGVGVLLNNVVGPILSGAPEILVLAMIAVVSLVLTNILNNNVVVITMCMTIVALAGQGIIANPVAGCMVALIGGVFGYYTPASSYVGALNHGHDYTTPASIYKYGLSVFAMLLIVCIVFVPIIVNIIA